MTDEERQIQFYQVLNHWKEARDNLAAIRARHAAELEAPIAVELSARAWVMSIAFPAPSFGTNNFEFGNGYQLKAVYKVTYKLDKDEAKIKRVEKLLPPAIAEDLIKYKPTLSQGAYNKLEPAHKVIANEVVTLDPSDKPTLELIEPKD